MCIMFLGVKTKLVSAPNTVPKTDHSSKPGMVWQFTKHIHKKAICQNSRVTLSYLKDLLQSLCWVPQRAIAFPKCFAVQSTTVWYSCGLSLLHCWILKNLRIAAISSCTALEKGKGRVQYLSTNLYRNSNVHACEHSLLLIPSFLHL